MGKRKKQGFFRKGVKRIAVILTILWAGLLIAFFANPAWAKETWYKTYNWLTDTTFQPQKKARPCEEYTTHAWQLSDSVEQYWLHSCNHGIVPLRYMREIYPAVDSGKLIPVLPNEHYNVDTMRYSFPFAVPKAYALIDTIAVRFQHKLINTTLAGTRLTVTSVLRTRSSVNRLLRHNRNAIRNSAHLHGTTFDISYATFTGNKPIETAEAEYLKEVLAQTLFELRNEQKCWVTYEIFQTCFHIVAR